MLCLAAVFAVALPVALGRRGIGTGLAILATAALIVFVLGPASRAGVQPLIAVWPIAGAICAVSILLIGGWSRKSFHAVGGCALAVLAAGWVPVLVGRTLHFTGLDVGFGARFHLGVSLWYAPPLAEVDFAGLLMAGMVLAGLGAMIDISMSVSSALAEVRSSAPKAAGRALAVAGLRIGRDVLGMTAISVALITVGDEFPLLLAHHVDGLPAGAGRLLSHEAIASAVVRVVSCVLATCAAIPCTALFAFAFPGGVPGQDDVGKDSEPARSSGMSQDVFLRVAVVLAAVAAIFSLSYAVDRSTRGWYHRRPATVEKIRGRPPTRVQRALARVVDFQPAVIDRFNRMIRNNPGRGPAVLREQVAVVQVETGEQHGALALADNVLGFMPTERTPLAHSRIVDVSVRSREDHVETVEINRPPVRFPIVLLLTALAASVAVAILGGRGVALVWALTLTLCLGSAWLMPWILAGRSPLGGGLLYALAALALFALFSGRWDRRTLAAFLGAGAGVLVALAVVEGSASPLELTGLSSTEARLAKLVLPEGARIDFADVLVCGVMLAIIGIVLDVGITVASAQHEVLRHDQEPTRRHALLSGLRVSRDVSGTHVLTLLFVWAGARMHVLFLPSATGVSFREFLNGESAAVEIVRVLGACLGILATGPATALFGAWLVRQVPDPPAPPSDNAGMRRILCVLGLVISVGAIAICVATARHAMPAAGKRSWARDPLPQAGTAGEYLAYARERLNEGEGGLAALALWRVIEPAPEEGRAYRDLAALYLLKGIHVPAHAAASEAVLKSPDDPDAHYVMGVVLAWLGEHDEAERHLRRALALDPEHPLAAEALEQLYAAP